MNGWIVLCILLGAALFGAVWQAVTLGSALDEVTGERDRAVHDRAGSARMFAVRKLLEVAYYLRKEATDRFTALGPEDQRAAAFWDAAVWVSEVYVPGVAGLPWDHDELRALADQVHHAHTRGQR